MASTKSTGLVRVADHIDRAAMGLPCVAARTTAIDANFRDTVVAFFRPGDDEHLADRVVELYRCPDRLEELARGSCNFVRRYSWCRVGKDYVELVAGLDATAAARRTA